MFVLPVSVVTSAPSCFASEESGHKKVRSHLKPLRPNTRCLLPRFITVSPNFSHLLLPRISGTPALL